jgi:hypothetical protein
MKARTARLAPQPAEAHTVIQYLGFEHLVCADGGVRNIVMIRPGDGGAHRDLQLRGAETEIVDLYFCGIGLLLWRGGNKTSRASI